MRNEAVCRTVGTDNIRMKMFDGHVRTLMSMLHVLDIRKNLLLLRVLEAQRHKFLSADEGVKLSKGL